MCNDYSVFSHRDTTELFLLIPGKFKSEIAVQNINAAHAFVAV